jgi:hypothetical protein
MLKLAPMRRRPGYEIQTTNLNLAFAPRPSAWAVLDRALRALQMYKLQTQAFGLAEIHRPFGAMNFTFPEV